MAVSAPNPKDYPTASRLIRPDVHLPTIALQTSRPRRFTRRPWRGRLRELQRRGLDAALPSSDIVASCPQRAGTYGPVVSDNPIHRVVYMSRGCATFGPRPDDPAFSALPE